MTFHSMKDTPLYFPSVLPTDFFLIVFPLPQFLLVSQGYNTSAYLANLNTQATRASDFVNQGDRDEPVRSMQEHPPSSVLEHPIDLRLKESGKEPVQDKSTTYTLIHVDA